MVFRSTSAKINSEIKIVPNPWLIPAMIDFLKNYLNQIKNPKILEFGSGCSTAFFAQFLGDQGQLITIEHNPNWYQTVQAYLKQHNLIQQVDLRLITNNCSSVCQEFADFEFDLVFIDAKDRLACLQACQRIVKIGGLIVFDDSQMREKYKQVDQIMANWPKTELVGIKSNPLDLTAPAQESATAYWFKTKN